MKRFFKLSSMRFRPPTSSSFISLLLLFGMVNIDNQIHSIMPEQAMPSDSRAHAVNSGQAVPSVHDMFKDVPQDELLQMMEEGQQFIKYLEEHGTPEEKMAFAQAMEETLQGFTEEDWKEFEQIVETVQDKLPPLVIEPKEAEPVVAQKETPKKEEPKVIIDNSLEKVLHDIHKAINALLLKAKSDKVLTERITISWDNKDNFNEMDRLLQTLHKKDHIAKLTTSKDEAIKSLLESIQNFNKRLQLENDNFVIADTFGLQADEETTATNLKKLNKILEFFDNAIESLLPKLVKFINENEPEALKKAKDHDDSAKKALDHATKIEKQKRPHGSSSYTDRSPSNGSHNNRNQSRPSYNGAQGYQPATPREQSPDYLEQVHRNNLRSVQPKSASHNNGGNAHGGKANADTQKDVQNANNNQYRLAIDNLETYLESNGNTEVNSYMATVGKTGDIYKSFGTPISENDTTRFRSLQAKRSTPHTLNSEESRFLQKYDEQWQAANKVFDKNTQTAHTYYGSLSDSIANISPQLDEMSQVIQAVKGTLSHMNSQELETLNTSPALKNFAQRVNTYHATFKRVQGELKNKHKLHRLEGKDLSETRAYDELAHKVDNLHGLDRKISDVKSQIEGLHKAIKTAIARKKREEHKASQK